MAGLTYGTVLKVTIQGESHGKGINVVVDGCPAGLPLTEANIQVYLDGRKPGQSKFTTARQEGDAAEIPSGVLEGRTTGMPTALEVCSTNQRSHDHGNIMDAYRPGYADYTFDCKYEFRDRRDGGYSSGRETTGRVAVGAIACKLLRSFGITMRAYTRPVGEIEINDQALRLDGTWNNRLYMLDAGVAQKAQAYLKEMMARRDSCGGVVECVTQGMPVGVDEPALEKLDANLAKVILSIGVVRGSEIRDGFEAVRALEPSSSDGFIISRGGKEDGKENKKEGGGGNGRRVGQEYKVVKNSNHSGGTPGGINDGNDIVIRAAFKLTPFIARSQHTAIRIGQESDVEIRGRHDPIIVLRAVVVVKAMAALTAAGPLPVSMTSRPDRIQGPLGCGQNCTFKGQRKPTYQEIGERL